MDNKLISVIIPVYNTEKYLDRCVKSVAEQTYKNLEIILVNDGSSDNSPAICDEWAKKDSRIKVVHKQNGGVSSARNAGLDISTGEYIQFVDSDDYLEENFCKNIMSEYSSDVDLVVSGFSIIDDYGTKKTTKVEENIEIQILKSPSIFMKYLYNGYNDMPVNKVYKRNLITKGFLNGVPLGEDRIFNLDYLSNVKNRVILASEAGYVYEFNQGSACHKERDNFYEILKISVDSLKNFLIKQFGDFGCPEFYKLIGDTFVDIIKRNSKSNIKEVYKKIQNDENYKIYIKNYKPQTIKEKVKHTLFKLKMFSLIRMILRFR